MARRAFVGVGDRDRDGLSNTRGAEGERFVRGVKLLSRATPGAGAEGVRDRDVLVAVAVAVAPGGGRAR